MVSSMTIHLMEFQSTLPVWGATCQHIRFQAFQRYFNPRSPCGERRDRYGVLRGADYFNPRSPCGERRDKLQTLCWQCGFQSTLPVWGATSSAFMPSSCLLHFNPRSPCGERHMRSRLLSSINDFNPRSPCGERRGMRATLPTAA